MKKNKIRKKWRFFKYRFDDKRINIQKKNEKNGK